MNGKLKIPSTIVIKPKVRFGQPTLKDSRIAIADILVLLEAGYRIDEIPCQYPEITLKQARDAVAYAVTLLGKRRF